MTKAPHGFATGGASYLSSWAWDELNVRPHAYQATPPRLWASAAVGMSLTPLRCTSMATTRVEVRRDCNVTAPNRHLPTSQSSYQASRLVSQLRCRPRSAVLLAPAVVVVAWLRSAGFLNRLRRRLHWWRKIAQVVHRFVERKPRVYVTANWLLRVAHLTSPRRIRHRSRTHPTRRHR